MKWTEQQQEAIMTEGSDILVSAAAGSGKTAVLTERIRRLVTEKQIPLERMLVVTFTNAAASEMKEKILKALREEEQRLDSVGAPGQEDRREKRRFVRRQIRNASSAEICTFHRFSMDVIRHYFFLTDIDPHFKICDESYGNILREKCLDDLFEEKFSSGDEDFLRFLDAYSDLKSEKKIRRMIGQVYDFMMNMAEPFDWLHEHVLELDCTEEGFLGSASHRVMRAGVKRDLEQALSMAEKLTEWAAGIPELNEDPDGKGCLYQKIEENCLNLKSAFNGADTLSDEELADRLSGIKWNAMRVRKHEKDAFSAVKDAFSEITKKYKELVKKALQRLPRFTAEESAGRIRSTYPCAVILEKLVIDFAQRFTAAKREKNMLDFNDVEHEAYRILNSREHPEAAEEYRDRFEVIFIDEYQDSSRIQEAIIRSVSRGNNVYMVGDVKQSIYKFRQADPDIFIGKYNGFEEGSVPGKRIDLSRNFRSKGAVIDAVNGIFRNIMTRELSGIAYDEAAELVQGSGYPRGGDLDYGVSLHLIDAKNQTESAEEGRDPADEEIERLSRAQMEGELIARLAEERIGQMIFDDKKGFERPAGYGDIVVLVRSSANMDIYARSLMERGLPAYVSGGEGFYQAPEVEIFMDLLKLLDNHRRDKELISVLYSSIGGFAFSLDELASVRIFHTEEGRADYSEAFFDLAYADKEELPDSRLQLSLRCFHAAELLKKWRTESRYMPLDDFIWKLLIETGYYAYVSALPGGRRRAANLRLLVDRAGEYVRNYGGGLFSFLRFEEQLKERGARIAQAVNAGDSMDMIRIMTIHKSKGLEFPIVIIPDIGANIRHDADSNDLQLHKDLGIALKYRSHDRHIEYRTLPYESILQVKREEDVEEEKRILYVAMTRARDELVLTASKKDLIRQLEKYEKVYGNGQQSPDRRLFWVYYNAEEAGIRVYRHRAEEFAGEIRQEERSAFRIREAVEQAFPEFVDTEGLLKVIQKRLDYRYPYKRDSAAKSKYSVTELNRAMHGGELGPVQYAQIIRSEQEEEEKDPVREKKQEEMEILYQLFPDSQTDRLSLGVLPDGQLMMVDLFSDDVSDPEGTAGEKKVRNVIHPDSVIPKFLSGEKEITPALRGTLTHRVLELIDYVPDMEEERVKGFLDELVQKGILSAGEAAVVSCEQVVSFFSSELGRRACRAEKRRNEWAFTLRKKTAELASMAAGAESGRKLKELLPEEVLIQGIIDCCFRDEKGIVIIDFKTDHVTSSDRQDNFSRFREIYRRQLDLYREAVEKEYGESVSGVYLFMLEASQAVAVSDREGADQPLSL